MMSGDFVRLLAGNGRFNTGTSAYYVAAAEVIKMTGKTQGQGVSLYEAARRMKVPYAREAQPRDRYIVAGGLNFHYLDWGNEGKQPILLLHGVAQQAHSWDLVSLALSSRFHVLALEARGHGDSQWPSDGDYSVEAHQGDLDAVVEALGLRSFVLIGHSMGGRNAYVFTSRKPQRVRALVIVDTGPGGGRQGRQRIRRFMTLPDELDSYDEFAQRVQEYTGRPPWLVHGSLRHSVRQLPNGKWTWKYDKAIRSRDFNPPTWSAERLWGCLGKIGCPTLVVKGVNSDVLSPETFRRMVEIMPDARGAVVAKAGHLVPGDNPSGFLEALDPFLQGFEG